MLVWIFMRKRWAPNYLTFRCTPYFTFTQFSQRALGEVSRAFDDLDTLKGDPASQGTPHGVVCIFPKSFCFSTFNTTEHVVGALFLNSARVENTAEIM